MRDFQPRSLGKTRLGTTAAASRPFGRLGPFVASLLRASDRREREKHPFGRLLGVPGMGVIYQVQVLSGEGSSSRS